MAAVVGISIGALVAWGAGALLLEKSLKASGAVDFGDKGARVAAGGGEGARIVGGSAGGLLLSPLCGRAVGKSVSFKNLPL